MRFHARAIALASVLLLGAFPTLAADRALLVGVSDYLDDNISDLAGPKLDVPRMRKLLVDELAFPPSSIKELSGADSTRANILQSIQSWLIDGTQAGDRVYLYFSSHGTRVTIPDGNGGTRVTTGLMPYDASYSVSWDQDTVGGVVLGSQLGRLLRSMTGRIVTVVVDACHSGSLTRGTESSLPAGAVVRTVTPHAPARLDPAEVTDELIAQTENEFRLLDFNAKDGTPIENVAVWNGATISQYTWEGGDGGIYTNAYIAGISQRRAAFSGDGRVSASSLLAFVRQEAEKFCVGVPRCAGVGFTPELLAPDDYRASIIVPFSPGGSLFPDDEVVAPPPVGENLPPAPDQPELVNLAEGVFAHQNDFRLEAGISPSARVKQGDTVRFAVRSELTGKVVILDTSPDGMLRRIFPNDYSEAVGKDGFVVGGRTLTIPDESYPFEFTANDAGPGTLVVLVTEPDVDLAPLLQSAAFEVIDNVDRALVAVAAELQDPVTETATEPSRARKWAFVTVPYMVGP